MLNPVILNSVNDVHKGSVLLDSVVWVGTTTVGDTVELSSLSGDVLWQGIAQAEQTYLPYFFNDLLADGGFKLSVHTSGKVLVYLGSDANGG